MDKKKYNVSDTDTKTKQTPFLWVCLGNIKLDIYDAFANFLHLRGLESLPWTLVTFELINNFVNEI